MGALRLMLRHFLSLHFLVFLRVRQAEQMVNIGFHRDKLLHIFFRLKKGLIFQSSPVGILQSLLSTSGHVGPK
ncbi:hypothetical protein [Pelotomaculum sp. FP]|uniref:hypothetical protein n=1 Tax=Pelotomaculum sp. FP TaxID=261474 RepID=UPI001290D8E1|nr:hypothetical protein [Pelotomaculum sp. FP]